MKTLFLPLMLAASCMLHAETPKRIVSASGNASEVIARFGLADNLVAVDTTSLLPPEVMSKKRKIGYRRKLSAEGILSMSPDLIILAPDAGPPGVVEQLKNSGVPLFYLKDEQTLDGINRDIEHLGEVLEVPDKAAKLIESQKAQAAALEKSKANYPKTPRVVVLLDTGGGAFGLGKGSAGEHFTKILGAEPALTFDGMKELSNEVLATSDADVILVAARNDAEDPTIIKPLKKGRYKAIDIHPTMPKGCAFQVNIMKTLGFGPDTAGVAQEIADTILPCIQ